MTNYDKKPEFNAREAGENTSTTIAIIVAALVLVVGAFLYFGSTSTTPTGQQLTENQVHAGSDHRACCAAASNASGG